MGKASKIVTVGLCPSWDLVCRFDGIDWGDHKLVDSSTCNPAGKAMNISRALAWVGRKNVAAGLWGRDDYEQLKAAIKKLRGLVTSRMTVVTGGTRRNVSVVDTVREREMHIKLKCELASDKALRRLGTDLRGIVKKGNLCVFAGLMPESEFLGRVVRILQDCGRRGAKIAVDTYGEALRRIVDTGAAWMICPNVDELRELLGENIADRPSSLVKAAKRLLDKVEIVLVSRGKRGAIVVSGEGAWQGRCVDRGRVLSTVGCGDYLLGGFLKGLTETQKCQTALKTALRVATAKAWGWTEEKSWAQAQRKIRIEIRQV